MRRHEALAQRELRQRVQRTIQAHRLTQREVAERVNVSQKHLSRMLTGESVLSLDWAERILALVDIHVTVELWDNERSRQP